ncbi:MAG: hypothetical protein KIS79_10875 [Burkholderiales bacterium]|nr:hypothetical protein [Burkholderiales bacterium]
MNVMAALLWVIAAASVTIAQAHAEDEGRWVVSWAASAQGPYPSGNPSAQPDLGLAFPSAQAHEQSFRLIVRPTLWGREARLRFSNVFGTRAVTFDGVFIALQQSSAAVVSGTNRPVTFDGGTRVTLPAGASTWSDPVTLDFVTDPASPLLADRKLAVSFHVVGESGPMTWHAKALQTSYVTAPNAGARSHEETEASYLFTTTSWYFLDALDVRAPADAFAVVAFGDSITDGTLSTLNGDDRWPDVLARRLRASYGNRAAVVNAGIGGNQVVGPQDYSPDKPFAGGPSALARLERDVLSLSGVAAIIWLESVNDFSSNGNASVEAVQTGMHDGVARMRAAIPGVCIIGATLTPVMGATLPAHGSAEQEAKRAQLNQWLRDSDLFDALIDFERVTMNPSTGAMHDALVPNTTVGGAGDKLHPNRIGYLRMGSTIDLGLLPPRSLGCAADRAASVAAKPEPGLHVQ